MIVVSDTSPVNYLVLIGKAELIHCLFDRVVVPQVVVPPAHFLENRRSSTSALIGGSRNPRSMPMTSGSGEVSASRRPLRMNAFHSSTASA